MSLLVQKYGGSSVRDPAHIKEVASRIKNQRARWRDIVVVVSAMGKSTNELIQLARAITPSPNKREMDMLLTAGERITMSLLAIALEDIGCPAVSLTGSQSGIITDNSPLAARILEIRGDRIRENLDLGKVVVVAGFQGVSKNREVTTLGRGGSDTTAVALSISLKAEMCEIRKDVDGVFTADPRIVKSARKLDRIPFDAMLELASWGSRVLHFRSVLLAQRFQLPLWVGSSLSDGEGTLLCTGSLTSGEKSMERSRVLALTHSQSLLIVGVAETKDPPLFLSQFQSYCHHHGLLSPLMCQLSSPGIWFALQLEELQSLPEGFMDRLGEWGGGGVTVNENCGAVTLVGEGIAQAPELVSEIFKMIATHSIPVVGHHLSTLSLILIIEKKNVESAVQTLHDQLNLGVP